MMGRRKQKNNKKRKPRNRRRPRTGIDRNSTLIRTYGPIIQNQMNFLPPWIEAPMRYADNFIITIAAGGVADYIYRANSLFDPDRTSTGHQPLGFDQLAAVYNRYRVDKLEWYIEMPSTAVTYSGTVVLVNGAANLTTSSISQEYPTARFHSVGFNGSIPAVFTGHKSLPKYNGKSVVAYNTDDTTGALVTTNPVETIDLHIFMFNNNVASVSVQLNVSLKYRAVFYDPITPTQSFKTETTKTFIREKPIITIQQEKTCEDRNREFTKVNDRPRYESAYDEYLAYIRITQKQIDFEEFIKIYDLLTKFRDVCL